MLNNTFALMALYGIGVVLAVLFLTYFFDRIFIKKRVSKIDIILLIYIIVLPVYSAINANFTFDQSIVTGLLSAIAKQVSILFVILYQFMIRAKRVKVSTLFNIVIFFVWIDVAVKFYMTQTLNPALLVDTDLVGYNPAKGGYVFRFDSTYVQVAVMYYFTIFILSKKPMHLLFFGLFMAYMLFVDKGRIDIMTLFVAMLFSMVRNLKGVNFVKTASVLAVVGAIGLFIGYQIAPDAIIVLRNMLGNFILTVIGQDTGEGSASSRFIQFGIVFNHFLKYPGQMVFGIGLLQREEMSWIFGHLYLSDIGIVGLFFSFGIVGVIVLYSFFIYCIRLTWKVKHYKKDVYYKLTETILVLLFVTSFFNGSFVWASGNFLTFLLFLHTFTLMEKDYANKLVNST